jgi:hypothetical protein
VTEEHMTEQQPVIRITKGNPTDEEIAAVIAVVTAQAATRRTAEPEPQQTGWAAYWRRVQAPIQPGPGAWQAAVRGW